MRIAAAAWPLEWHDGWSDYAAKLGRWIDTAEADLLVFPEYAGMEAALIDAPARDTPQYWLDHGAEMADRALDLHRELAIRAGRHVLMGSLPVRTGSGIVNRAHLIGPDGGTRWQDKQIPTPWERAETSLVPGDPLRGFEVGGVRVAILVCHDAEFPPLARALPCDVLLIPACTDGPRGATRVRNAARARALEGCCIPVLSQTLGEVPNCAFLDVNRGRAGVYAPPDRGFPDDGTLAERAPEEPGWVRAEIDMDALQDLRERRGEVRIAADWPEAERRAALAPGYP